MTGFQASFWFTDAFYRDAGARFLLDSIASILMAPQLSLPLALMLIVLFPGARDSDSDLLRRRLVARIPSSGG
jgi:hypothetical protein